MSERKLARVVVIDEIFTHENSDNLELAIVGGWQVCIKKGEFTKGDLAVYFECDALIPLDSDQFTFLENKSNVTRDGKRYARIKTIKLRKELSQGLLMPLSMFKITKAKEDADMTAFFGVIKYEKVAEPVAGQKGSSGSIGSKPFPSFIFKTDQERVQNLARHYKRSVDAGDEFEVTYKLDGSSFTAYLNNGKYGVCSRNIELNLVPEKWSFLTQCKEWFYSFKAYNKRALKWSYTQDGDKYKFDLKWNGIKFPQWKTENKPDDNAFTKLFIELNLENKLRNAKMILGCDLAIQGEMVGPSIQSNFEGVEKNTLYVYNIFNINSKTYINPEQARKVISDIGLNYVPVFSERMKLPEDIKDTIKNADGPSGLNGKYREGLVYKSLTSDFSFKVISNNYLMKEE